jgi:hypothetical protein
LKRSRDRQGAVDIQPLTTLFDAQLDALKRVVELHDSA